VLQTAAGGRGTVVFLRGDDGDWALRHYHRGGLPGRFLDDHFLWLGAAQTRSFREWRLLRRLHAGGLPVPRPIAARYRRRGVGYTADLLTARIPGAEPLSARLARAPLSPEAWRRIGRCLRRFHDAGVFHADLNAHNLLLDEAGTPWVLDFDRGRLRPPGAWRRRNLERFWRSLRKLDSGRSGIHAGAGDRAALLEGYGENPAR
jgi:3-deoxy-D-manno-octulosonic acid kinase